MKNVWPVKKHLYFRKLLNPSQTTKLSDFVHNFYNSFIEPYEAQGPKMITRDYPGPKAIEFQQHMSHSIANVSRRDVIDIEKSFGNFFTDIDGNVILDMHMDHGRNAFGYNHRNLIRDANFEEFERFTAQRPALGLFNPLNMPSN